MEQKMIDREKVNAWVDAKIKELEESASLNASAGYYHTASRNKELADTFNDFRNKLINADIYADPQPEEPKWHYEEITEENLPKYYGREVEVWDKDSDYKRIAILRGYIPKDLCKICADTDVASDIWWVHGRVKVYDS